MGDDVSLSLIKSPVGARVNLAALPAGKLEAQGRGKCCFSKGEIQQKSMRC